MAKKTDLPDLKDSNMHLPRPNAKDGYFCKAKAKKNWNCNLAGFEYNFKEGDIVDIKEKWHLDKLIHPHIDAVYPL